MKKYIFHLLTMISFLCCLGWVSTVSGQSEQDLFLSGNKALQEGKYDEAREHYLKLLQQGVHRSTLYYNLGTLSFRQHRFGEAIFYYRKSLQLAPRDADIKYNLAFARKKAVDKIEGDGDWQETLWRFFPINQQEVYWLLWGSCVFFWGMVILTIATKKRLWIPIRNVWGCILLFALVLVLQSEWGQKPFGVVTVTEAPVYSATGKDNVVLFSLHEGAEFSVQEVADKTWLRIELDDGKRGWVRSVDVLI